MTLKGMRIEESYAPSVTASVHLIKIYEATREQGLVGMRLFMCRLTWILTNTLPSALDLGRELDAEFEAKGIEFGPNHQWVARYRKLEQDLSR